MTIKERTLKEIYEEYSEKFAEYTEFFGFEPPHCHPAEFECLISEMDEAINNGQPLPPTPEGSVT